MTTSDPSASAKLRAPRAPVPVLLLVLLLPGVSPAQAPDGWRTHRDAESGVSFYYPVEFREIPLEPTETVLRARYVRRNPPEKIRKDHPGARPAFEIFVIAPGKGGVTPREPLAPAADAADAAESREAPASAAAAAGAAPRTVREAMLASKGVNGFDDFVQKRLRGQRLSPLAKARPPFSEFALLPANAPANAAPQGIFVGHRELGGNVVGVVYRTHPTLSAEAESEFRRILRSLSVAPVADSDPLTEHYARRPFRNAPRRIEVRRSLPKGWKAIDTENFIIVHHTDNEKLVNKIARDLEAIRPLFEKLFPPVRPVEAVSVVRVCRNAEEFRAYGAPPNAGGFWHVGNEELVFFDYYQTLLDSTNRKMRRITDRDSLLVLYHEAFHQYIHYAVGEIDPPDWFNEGHGDYFSGALIPEYGTKVATIGPSRWRITLAKDLCEGRKPGWVPLGKLLAARRAEYYNPQHIASYYACGWAFVYFMREAPEVRSNAAWAGLVDDFFEALKKEWNVRLAALGEGATLAAKSEAAEAAKNSAFALVWKDVDLAALETAFRAFLTKLRHPWPEDRGKS